MNFCIPIFIMTIRQDCMWEDETINHRPVYKTKTWLKDNQCD